MTNINSPVLTISNIDPDAASVKATITNDSGELISASTASENDDGTGLLMLVSNFLMAFM